MNREEYKEKYYPPFILGSAYVIAKNSIEKLIKSAYETPFFPLEDVFTTGIVRKKAGVSFKNIERTYFGTTATKSFYKGKVIFLVGLTPKKRKLIWNRLKSEKKGYI
ncbi:hypothetical protein Anas_11570 [Armadillidium nasatum]|uniref:Hexosyltransferase n=1 Tax=Armadillidium nasatum TaxID=96803 RepID=A0A5N5T8F6_9CRUS|nr:hypothetical protein Anas_11570 [Armadillidium nasatum]